MNKIDKIKKLVEDLNFYRDAYYNQNTSVISDYEYDCLFSELEQLEEKYHFVLSNSPTVSVGYEVKSKLEKVTHSHPMLSLDKTKSTSVLEKMVRQNDMIMSLKMDGLTLLLTYENGKLIKAETRGNGVIGEDVLHNVKTIKNIPIKIPIKEHFEIEGEAIITYNDFKKIQNLNPDSSYKNPRNLVSGSIRQLDSYVASQRNIKFIAWKVPSTPVLRNENTFSKRLLFAEALGFTIVPFVYYDTTTDTKDTIDHLKAIAEEKHYPIDGMVVTYNDVAYGESLGSTGHHPKHSLAFKFYDEEVISTILDVEWTMGKTQVLTPVAVFKPVDIEGTTVERASVHNITMLKELELQIGDEVSVYKANMIIPQIRANLSKNMRAISHVEIPTTCPYCNSDTKIINEQLFCTNPYCSGKALGQLKHFVSKEAMNIEGLSEMTINCFLESGFIDPVNTYLDIYELKNGFYDDIVKMKGFGKKSTDKLMEAIENSKKTTLERFIYALCIPLIGKSASKMISKYFKGDAKEFLKAWESGSFDWTIFQDFGSEMSKSMNVFIKNNQDKVDLLFAYLSFESNDSDQEKEQILNNKTFVVTGSLYKFKNRNELVELLESYGAKVVNSISKNTSYLINNDINSTSSKNKKAKELNIPIITEKEVLKIIKQSK